jgi:cysteinyl-tRNA synthetase
MEFKETDFEEPKRELEYLYNALRNIMNAASPSAKESAELKEALIQTKKKFADAMNDDFNTPLAITQLYALAKKINVLVAKQKINCRLAEETVKSMRELGNILGILEKEIPAEGEVPEKVKELIARREKARGEKDWKRADEIRAQISRLGYVVEDTSSGPKPRKTEN